MVNILINGRSKIYNQSAFGAGARSAPPSVINFHKIYFSIKTMNTYKILVTGGNGLLGSALKYETKNTAAEWIFVNSTDVNLLNMSEVQTIFSENNPTHVVHLAGIVGGLIFNMENNLDLFRLNHQINDNVLKAAAESKSVKKVISCLSTCIFPSEDINYPIKEKSLHKGLPHDSNIG
jgi:GDP-L-fucose synthase